MTIWKYEINITEYVSIDMPYGAQILTVQKQGDKICLWAVVSPQAKTQLRNFMWAGTGQPLPDTFNEKYIGTVQFDDGKWVFHLFEIY